MISAALSPLANHLWQSTLCVAVVWLLTRALRRNRASVRYGLWLAASLKFLIPFSLLVTAGGRLGWRSDAAIAKLRFAFVMDEISRPFSVAPPAPFPQAAPPSSSPVIVVLFALWLCGIAAAIISWLRIWRRISLARRSATLLHLDLPVPVMSSRTPLEPGVFGIFRPVLLVPEGIAEYLTPPQLRAILAHELCHVRRRDNLTGALHMLVEAIFWFHPLVWWIRARLVAERERACDEEVLRTLRDPETYAAGILSVCKLYLESPLVCASGVTGSDLKRRIETIIAARTSQSLNSGRRILLAAVAFAAVAAPIAVGVLHAPPGRAQSPAAPAARSVFEVASVKQNKNGGPPRLRYNPAGIDFSNVPLVWIVGEAYQVPHARISSSDPHTRDLFFSPAGTAYLYDIAARAARPVSKEEIRPMLRALLESRFKLALHRESRVVPVYKLVRGQDAPQLHESADQGEPAGALGLNGFVFQNVEMPRFAAMLSVYMDRPVVDGTGLKGSYDFTLKPDLQGGAEKAALAEWFSSSIFGDIRKQLRLQLEPDKAAVDYLVVDHVEQPTEN